MTSRPLVAGVSWLDYGLWRRPELATLLGCRLQRLVPLPGPSPAVDVLIGWGCRRSGRRAAALAVRHGLPCWRLEDGFLRSLYLGDRDPPLSVVVDDEGIYYDASRPSRLETLVRAPLDEVQRARAKALRMAWCEGRVSKYNHLREFAGHLPVHCVLVVDQTVGDASITRGQADGAAFQRMLAVALAENPDATVLVKIHPDVFAGRKRGHFDPQQLAGIPRVQVLAEDVHPVRLLEHAQCVYTVTSQVGFEALLWGRPVRTFGMPFYAGWGLTRDELPAPSRRRPVPLESLVHAALVAYPRYVDPETGMRCEVEQVLAHLALQRRMRSRFPPKVTAVGFSAWKRPIVSDYFSGSAVRFVRRAGTLAAGETAVVWSRKPLSGALPPGSPVVRVEDGFLRSAGLGADLVRPLSWVMDTRGIYFDSTVPSDLEHLLLTHPFDGPLRARAVALRETVCAAGLSKYNVGAGGWRRPAGAGRVILVPGQVESDASIRYGCPGPVRTNHALLAAVRAENPDAYLVYKPHPDVAAGLRDPGSDEHRTREICDEVVGNVPMPSLLAEVDEVHTMTSLTGFEALLRGRRVVTWGQPFYAGWGLTGDRVPVARRDRRLALDDLVAGALILYPAYVSRVTGRYTTPERAVRELIDWRTAGVTSRSQWRTMLRLLTGLGRWLEASHDRRRT